MGPVECVGCCVALCVLLVGLHLLPHIVAAVRHGDPWLPPGPIGFKMLASSFGVQVRRLGATSFASKASYRHARSVVLSESARTAYYNEGYLILRNLLPVQTVTAIREALLSTFGTAYEPYDTNAWMTSDALLDLYIYGPFGQIASQLFGGGRAHLYRSVHHFRGDGWSPVPVPHFDDVDCEDGILGGFPPASLPKRSRIKFWVGLDAHVPGMHFLNQSMQLEALRLMADNTTHGERLVELYLAGRFKEVISDMYMRLFLVQKWPNFFDDRMLTPRMNLGDAIVHTPCLFHKSPTLRGRGVTGFLAPSYAAPDSRYLGALTALPSLDNRECDSGMPLSTHADAILEVAVVPRPECFPQAFPRPAFRGVTELRLPFRYGGNPIGTYFHSQGHAWRVATAPPEALNVGPREPPITDLQASNVVIFEDDGPPSNNGVFTNYLSGSRQGDVLSASEL